MRAAACEKERAASEGKEMLAALKRRGGAMPCWHRELLWEAGKRWKGDVPFARPSIAAGLEANVSYG